MLENILPEALMGLAEGLMRELYTSNVLAVVSVTVLVALWSASRRRLRDPQWHQFHPGL